MNNECFSVLHNEPATNTKTAFNFHLRDSNPLQFAHVREVNKSDLMDTQHA